MVSHHHVQYQKKTNYPILRKFSDGWTDRWSDRQAGRQTERQTDRQTDRQKDRRTDESDSIGCCPTNVEHPILLLSLQCEVYHKKAKTYYSCVKEPDNFYLYSNRKTQPVLHLDLIPVRILLENFKKPAPNTTLRGFSWGRWLVIFADHWTTNDLKVARQKSITIIYFFLSEIIFREKMISLSNNQ